MANEQSITVTTDTWEKCYNASWVGLVPSGVMAHPAKYSRALIQRLYQHAREEGWLVPGSVVLDPFAGTGLGGLDSGLQGYQFLGVELEPRFCALFHGFDCGGDGARHEACSDAGPHEAHHVPGNLELWQRRYGALPQWVQPIVLQGDSRRLQEVLRTADLCCSSPPYNLPMSQDHNGAHGGKRGSTPSEHGAFHLYGTTPGQLEGLPPGSVEAVLDCAISSPPYANQTNTPQCTRYSNRRDALPDGVRDLAQATGNPSNYGTHPGQLGNLSPGRLGDALVASPPYGDQQVGTGKAGRTGWRGYTDHGGGTVATPGQMAALPTGDVTALGDTPETFWASAKVILSQVFAVLKPGAHAIWVTRMYVRDSQLIDFPNDWRLLCESCGFITLHEHHALLTEHHGTQTTLFGGETVHRTKRVSFFRRLAEKNGSPVITHETIYCMVKPHAPVPLPPDEAWEQLPLLDGVVVSSPPYAESIHSNRNGIDWTKTHHGSFEKKHGHQAHSSHATGLLTYGTTAGQLGAMPVGQPPDCLISSPPYAGAGEVLGSHNGIDYTKAAAPTGTRRTPGRQMAPYGTTSGQLGAMVPGTLDGVVVSSPPYIGTQVAACEGNMGGGPGGRKASALTNVNGNIKHVGYGTTSGQLGAMPAGHPPGEKYG